MMIIIENYNFHILLFLLLFLTIFSCPVEYLSSSSEIEFYNLLYKQLRKSIKNGKKENKQINKILYWL